MSSNEMGCDPKRQEQVQEAVLDSNQTEFFLMPEEKIQADYERRNGRPYQEYFQKEYDVQHRKAFGRVRKKETYSPAISGENSRNVRRIAWAARRPMTKTLDEIIVFIARSLDHKKICESCKDKSFCNECLFNET